MTNIELTIGSLVQWPNSGRDDEYGVVTDTDHRYVYVRWDAGEGRPVKFSSDESPIERVDITQKRCRRFSSGDIVMAMSRNQSDGEPMWQCISMGDFAPVIVPESDLRPIPITEPVERIQNNMIGSLNKYRLREVTQWYLWQHMNNELVSLGNVRVDIKPHQVGVVHKVVSNYPHRFLLCDEVGLGKTIEAGMALRELRSRGGARRALIIVPPNLARQWQFEMLTKFNERFAILDTATVRYLINQGQAGNPFARYSSVICSSSWVVREEWAELCKAADWDLIIVDEVQHVRRHEDGQTTRLYDLVNELARADSAIRRSLLLLTATPMQLGTHEIYALVEMLDPVLFPSPEDFERHRNSVPGLNRLVENIKSPNFSGAAVGFNDVAEQVSQWLEIDIGHARQRLTAGPDELGVLADELSDLHRLSEVMIRNRKSVIGGFMPRVAARWAVELSQEERAALKALEEYIEYGFNLALGTGGNTVGFVMVTFQKLMASSIAAIRSALHRRRDRVRQRYNARAQSENELDERLDDDYDSSVVVGSVGATQADEEIRYIEGAIDALNRVRTDSKSAELLEQMGELRDESPNQKVIIFTQYRETQRHLADLLESSGWEVNQFHGQMDTMAKDRAVERFRTDEGPQVLVSTEAGGEGRNFQFCHTLVNYDLPWNPMKVEQRIGRVDRIGQEREVRIFNLFSKDTIEERVLDVLEHRINVFEETVGGLDPILGDTENDIKAIMRMGEDARDAALEDLGARLETEVRDARVASEHLGDFIMDTKSYGREIAERISSKNPSPIKNEDIDRFMGQLLADARTYIKSNGDEYELTFRSAFVDDHRDLFADGNKISAVFRPDRRSDSQYTEFMAFGNPIVDAIVEDVCRESYNGATGTRRILAGDDVHPTSGWVFTYMFGVKDARSTEHLVPIFISDNGELDEELGRRITERACLFDRAEQEIPPDEIPNNIGEVKTVAERFAADKRTNLQANATHRANTQVTQEVDRLTKYYDYRERVASDKLRRVQATLTRLSETLETAQQRQVLVAWEGQVREAKADLNRLLEERKRRMDETEKFRYPAVDYSLKSLGRIEVVGAMDAEDESQEELTTQAKQANNI